MEETQLSQRGPATCLSLRPRNVNWRSLKVIGNGTIRKLGYDFLFAFRSNYGRIFSRFDTIHEHDRHPAKHRTTRVARLQ